jgi:two-component system response regulator DctR
VAAGGAVIHVVDDEEPLRDALAWLLKSHGLTCRAFESAESFLAYLQAPRTQRNEPGCVLLDIRMPGLGGEGLFAKLRDEALCPAWPVIFLTGHGDVSMAVAALKHGAFDFVEKPFSDNSLVERLLAALAESGQRLERASHSASLEKRLATLTPRERDVMELVVAGHYNKVIADRLGIVMRTVEVYRAKIFEKMGVKSAVELASLLAKRREP